MAKIKGSMLVNRLKFIDERGNPEKKQKVISLLSPEFQKEVLKGILAVTWYPLDYVTQIVKAIDQVLGKGDMGLYEDIGYHSAAQAARGIYSLFFKLGSPEFIMNKAPTLWRQLMDNGECYVQFLGNKKLIIGIRGMEMKMSIEVFLGLKGWTCALLEKSGAKNVKVGILKYPADDLFGGELSATWE
jgi:hypothetical protein